MITTLAVFLCLAPTADLAAFVRVSPRDARYLELSDGSFYPPIGLNLIGPRHEVGDAEGGLRAMERWISKLAAQGGNFIRVWLSHPFWDVEHERSGFYDVHKAQRINRLLEICRRHGVRVKFTLEHFRTIGEPTRQSWADKPIHHVSRGGPAHSIADFFDGQAAREQFRKKIRWYAERYAAEPAIFGWELWNEINAVRGGDFMAWTEVMLPSLHEAFPRHLAMQSLGSFDRAELRELYHRHSTLPGNDLAQVHRYLDLGAELEVCHGPVDVLAADAVRDLLSCRPGRPVLLAESGAVEPRHTGPFRLYREDRAGIILHDVLFAPFFAGAAGPGHIWHWDVYVDANDLWWHFGRFAEAIRGLDPAGEHFQALMLEHPRLRIYVLSGERTLLAWCRDRQNTWRTELENKQPPQKLRGLEVDLRPLLGGRRGLLVRFYDPWNNRWRGGRLRGTLLRLPEFSRSIVFRIER